MKNFNFLNNLKWLLVPLVLLTISIGHAFAASTTYTWTFSSGDQWQFSSNSSSPGNDSGTATLNGVSWSYDRGTAKYLGSLNSSIQFGSKGNVETPSFTCSAFASYTITNVSVKASSYNGSHKVAISVGGSTVKSATATETPTSTPTAISTGTISKTGNVVITFSNGARALYLQEISITYETGGGGSCTDAPTVTAPSNGSVSLTQATLNCSSGVSTIGSNCTISSYGYVWGTSASPTVSGDGKHEVGTAYTVTGTGFGSYTVTGLTPNTTYYYGAYATNGAGSGYNYNSGGTFTTKALTATRNDADLGGVPTVVGNVITGSPNSGCTYADPAYTITTGNGSTTVEKSGNTFTVTSSTSTVDVNIQINYAEKGCDEKGGTNVTSGSSSSVEYGPIRSNYNYSTRQILYTKEDLDLAAGKKGDIKSIYFYYTGESAMAARNITIYMANTSLTALSNTSGNFVPSSEFTQVYSGSFSCSSTGWYEIMLDDAFAYNGVGNLVVLIDDNTGTWESSKTFTYHTASTTTGAQIHTYSDSKNEDPASTTWTGYTAVNNRPKTKFCIDVKDMTQYTVNWYVNGSVEHSQTGYEGTTLTSIPTPVSGDCDGEKVFVGWCATTYSNATTAPTFVSPTTMPNGGANYYAVFANSTTNYKKGAKADLREGVKVVLVNGTNAVSSESSNANKLDPVSISSKLSDNVIADPGSSIIWSVALDGDKYKFKQSTNYLNATSGSGKTGNLFCSATSDSWSIKTSSTYYYLQSTNASSRKLEYYSGNFTAYNDDVGSAYWIDFYVQVFENYATSCCTQLDAINGTVSTINHNSATLQWDKLSNVDGSTPYTIEVSPSAGTSVGSVDLSGAKATCTVTGLTCETEYTFTITANGASGYCNKSQEIVESTTECLCSNFSFHWGTSSASTATANWNAMNFRCFTQVGSSHEWQITDFVIGNTTDMNKFAVGWQNNAQDNLAYGSRTAVVTLESELFLAATQNCDNGKRPTVRYSTKTAEGAIGTLRMYDSHETHHDWNNCYVGFIPNGYGLMYGGSSATGSTLAMHATGNTNEWETDMTTLTSDMLLTNNTYKYQVGLLTSSDTYVDCGNSNPANFGSMGSFYGSNWGSSVSTYSAGTAGKFQIWTGDCTTDPNWRCHFVPYYTINYYDLDDELIGTDYVVYGTANTTLRTVSGHGWTTNSAADRSIAGSVTNAFGSSLTLSTSQPAGTYNFYLVAPGYTVTFSVPACVTAPSPVTSNSITLPAEPSTTPDGYTFAGWTTAAVASTTTAPTLYAAGDTYAPTAATTLYACYYSSDGAGNSVAFDVMKNSASIVAGYYIITPNRSNSANAMYNTIYNNTKLNSTTINGSGVSSTMSPEESGAVWQFIADGDYWNIKNLDNNKYLAAVNNNNSNQIEFVNSVSNDYARWTISLLSGDNNADTHVIYNKGKGQTQIGSTSNYNRWYLHQYSASSTPVWAANEIASNLTSTNGANLYFFYVSSSPNFGTTYTYTTSPTCKFNVAVSNVSDVTITATPSGGSAIAEGGNRDVAQGTTVTLNYTSLDPCYDFTTWTVTKVGGGAVSVTGASGNNATFTVPTDDDVIVTATITAKTTRTITYTIPSGGGSAVSPTTSVCDGGTVTLPSVTGISAEYSCETFIGWTTTAPNVSGTWASTPTIKAAGATSDAITGGDATFYAVYSRSGGGASGDVELTGANIGTWFTTHSELVSNGNIAYGNSRSITVGDYTWTTNGYQQGAQTSDYYLTLRERTNAGGVSWIQIPTMPGDINTITFSVTNGGSAATTNVLYFQSGTTSGESVIAASESTSSTSRTIAVTGSHTGGYITANGTIKVRSITVSYGPPPVISHALECGCLIDQFDLTYDANTANFPGSTTSCSGVDDYVFASHENKYTVCSTEPTLSGYKFTGWATNANGSGTVYTAGQEISCVPETPLTLYAQYERVYTIHFNDQSTVTDRTQSAAGAAVTVPSHTSPCSMSGATWEFAGWSKTGGSLVDAASVTIDIAANASSYTPIAADDGQTFYAVYKKTTDAGSAFTVGKTGYYKFYYQYDSKDWYACNNQDHGIHANNSTQTEYFYPQTFRFVYYPTGTYAGKYTIQRADGLYIGGSGNNTSLNFNASAANDNYYWTITSSGSGFIIQNVNTTTRYLSGASNANYNAKTTSQVLYFVAAPGVAYFTSMTCSDLFDMTFEDGGGTINWADGHPEGTYQDLANGTTVSTFPTATLAGWTFVGWTAGQGYSDMSKYSEGRGLDGSGVIFPDASDIYKTGGNSYTIAGSNITMYPIFTRFEDNEPFDEVNGGDYYIYYLASGTNDGYGADRRVYATTYDGEKRYTYTTICEDATLFTFTKLANGKWTIYDNSTHKYLVDKNDDWLLQQTTASGAEWTITVSSGNQFDAYCNYDSYQIIAWDNGTGATESRFQNYSKLSLTNSPTLYHRVYLGSCTNRVFSSNPTTTPDIDIKGTAVVTASQTGAIRATNVLTVSGHNLTPSTGTISITSNSGDIYFTTNTDDSFAEGKAVANQPKNTITVTANSSGIVVPTSIYVHYKPTGNTDGVTDVTVTATYSGAEDATTTVKARHVKENFAIAAKVADSWYALPANMGSSNVYEPTLIEVDESSNEAYGPSSVAYKLWPVKTTNGSGNRYAAAGDEVRFTGNSDNALWANNAASGTTTGIRNWAVVNSIDDGGSGSGEDLDVRYEWVISTEDGDAYTLNTNQSNNKRNLVIYRKNGQLVWATNGTYVTNELHLIPLTERTTITIIPREWKSNGLVFAIDADDNISLTSGHTTAKIGTGDAATAALTRHSTGGYGLYEVALPTLTSHYGKVLTLKMKIGGVDTYAYTTIPIIVTGTTTTTTAETPFTALDAATKDYDVVILDGAKLTTNATASHACSFQNFYVYPGGTWVNSNSSTSFSYLELRGGIKGIDAKTSHVQDVPYILLNKKFSSTAGANLDMTVYTDHGYALSVPFDVTLTGVNFANSLKPGTGAQVNGTLASQFWIRKYDGEVRANNGKGGWVDLTDASTTIHSGEGYTLQGKRPKGQPFAVIRFPFTGVADWADNTNGEVAKSAIPIYAHDGTGTTPDNDKGWNLIANPYMATIAYDTEDELSWAADFKVGSLVKTDGANWDGKYKWTNANQAYVTIPNDSYTAFPQTRASKATFKPFKNFFIQATDDGVVTFIRSDRAAMPVRLMAQTEETTPIYADINLTHGSESAQAGLTIDTDATTGYKFGEDYTIFENREALDYLKVYTIVDGHYLVGNTLTPAETAEMIPLEFYAPNTNGAYVFSLDEESDLDRLEYVILYDAELGINTNLLTSSYTVELNKTGLIENRFSIGLKIKEKENTATGVDDVGSDPERPFKFIYHDKMYILLNGQIYDATGKQVREIK